MHVIHHHPELMGTRNFNLTFPICDALFGTSDLDKGLIGTLFNGKSHAGMKSEDRRRMFGGDSSPEGARAGKRHADAADPG
jgi:sterol desaturase/sphingolipid hydroxylase (fatty acid hydroxylase superfamily)